MNKEWLQKAKDELKGRDLQTLDVKTPEGINLQPVYGEGEMPGDFPYRRGIKATMYTNRPWTLRQYAGFSTAEASNAFYRNNLKGGQRGLSVAFDLATHRGYDSDHPRVSGDVGQAGVAIDSVEDMLILFHQIPLDQVSVSMTMNGAVLPVMAAFIVAAEESGVSQELLSGTLQNDILKEFMVRNTYIYPPEPSIRITSDIIRYTSQHMPKFNPISISGYHMHEAGATAVQELAFTLADGLDYVRAALKSGLTVDEFAPRLSFFFGIGMNFFMEVAKLRAARVLWANLMQQFNPQKPESSQMRMHCQTSGVSLAARDPLNNITRTTLEALAAVLGGTQSLHTNSYDEALALPTPVSARISRNTQLILQHETGIPGVVDPLGGSHYVESLTDELIQASEQLIQEVEALGGMTQAILQGFPKRAIEESAIHKQARFEKEEDIIVGVNRFKVPDHEDEFLPELLSINVQEIREIQVSRLRNLKESRDSRAVQSALEALRSVALGKENLLEASIQAMRVRATVGEVSQVLEEVFTRYEAPLEDLLGIYAQHYIGDPRFELIQTGITQYKNSIGRSPKILMAKVGQDGHDRGLKMLKAALRDMGFDIQGAPLFQTPEEVVERAIQDKVDVLGISSQAAGHRTLVPEIIRLLRDKKAPHIHVICGGIIPVNDIPELKKIGVQAVFGPGTPVLEIAEKILEFLKK